jgi:LCP family protein required for cell wall assembly
MSDLRPRSGGTKKPSGVARHGRLPKFGPWGTIGAFIGAALVVVLVSGASVAGIAVWQLAGIANAHSVDIHPGETPAPPPGVGAYPGGFNILIVGSDTRAGQGSIGGGVAADTSILNDVTMLLHVSGDHTNATAVSIPRDMVVPIPQCANTGGAAGLPMNTALYYGGSTLKDPGAGLPCVVATVENLTGLKIQFAGLITFRGVIEMSNAVGGVPVCVAGPINDSNVGLHLKKAGTYNLKGLDALKFLRSRHGVGDGSDLGRISSQQVYLSALVRKIKSNDVLSNYPELYAIASAAVNNMQLSSSLKSPDTMIAIAQAMKNIPLDRIVFVQYPGTTGGTGIYSGKVQPLVGPASQLFSLIKRDKPFKLDPTTYSRGSTKDPNAPKPTTGPTPTPGSTATPTATAAPSGPVITLPGVIGQPSSEYTCSKPYSG